MDYLLVCLVAFLASALTFFSGFGLGTLLLPAFAIFFPMQTAVAMTAIVHFLNNLFKLTLVAKHAILAVVLRFGLPAIIAAYFGARLLLVLSELPSLYTYTLGSRVHQIHPVDLVVASLMILFAAMEILPFLKNISLHKKALPVGGLLSGFFGGLSGHQGALRSAFLIKCGLSKESFIGTGVLIACFIDVSRIIVYSSRISQATSAEHAALLAAATLSAFTGAFIGNRLLKKITLQTVRGTVATMLFLLAIGLGTGLI